MNKPILVTITAIILMIALLPIAIYASSAKRPVTDQKEIKMEIAEMAAPPTPWPGEAQAWEPKLKNDSTALKLKPVIISKKMWGAKDPMPERMTAHSSMPEFITVHHSGVKLSDNIDFYQKTRNLQSWCMGDDKKWGDTPYHYSIDYEGNIFEERTERYAGDTNTTYKPDKHLLIHVIGHFDHREFNKKQLQAVVDLAAWMAYRYEISPDIIKGHMDYSKTGCPGKNIQALINDGTITEMVKEKLKSAGVK
jgi:N-acetylmuramoyl-L-alanine amidase